MSSLLAQVVYKTNDDHVTVVAAGVTLHEALSAAEQLKKGRNNRASQRKTKRFTLSYTVQYVVFFVYNVMLKYSILFI